MADTAVQSLNQILAGGDYVEIPNVPIFDVHEEFDDKGQVVRRFTREDLEEIARRCNARESQTGDLSPIGPGHTVDGQPEQNQPPVWGYARNFHVDKFGPADKTGLLVDFLVKREYAAEVKSQYPRRSVELWPKDKVIDWIALLRRTPQRDLGLLTFVKQGEAPQRYAFDRIFADTSGRRPLAMAVSQKGKLRYAMDDDMDNTNATKQPQQPTELNPTAPPDAAAPDPEFADQVIRCIRSCYPHLDQMHNEAKVKYAAGAVPGATNGDVAPPPVPAKPAPQPSAEGDDPMSQDTDKAKADDKDAGKKAPPTKDDDEKTRMQRESEAIRYAKLETQMKEMEQQLQEQKLRYAKADCERIVAQLEYEGFELDRPTEVAAMIPLDEAGRKTKAEHIRKYYRQAPVSRTGMLDIGDLPGVPTRMERPVTGMSEARLQKCVRYQRAHPELSWEDAMAKCPE